MEIINRETIHSGRKFDLAVNTLRTRSGTEMRREYIRHPGSVILLPVLPDNRIVLERVYRHTIGQTLLELPAGTRSPDETFETTASRELSEETGYRAGKLELLLSFYPAPGVSDEIMQLFLASDLAAGVNALEHDEEIELQIEPFETALQMTRDGRIVDGKSILALRLYAELRRA